MTKRVAKTVPAGRRKVLEHETAHPGHRPAETVGEPHAAAEEVAVSALGDGVEPTRGEGRPVRVRIGRPVRVRIGRPVRVRIDRGAMARIVPVLIVPDEIVAMTEDLVPVGTMRPAVPFPGLAGSTGAAPTRPAPFRLGRQRHP